jgi:hypothetical protein
MPRKPTPKAPPFRLEDINGQTMLKLRLIFGWSQTKFYAPAGVCQSSGSKYETNERDIPDDTKRALAWTWERYIRSNAEQIGVRM